MVGSNQLPGTSACMYGDAFLDGRWARPKHAHQRKRIPELEPSQSARVDRLVGIVSLSDLASRAELPRSPRGLERSFGRGGSVMHGTLLDGCSGLPGKASVGPRVP